MAKENFNGLREKAISGVVDELCKAQSYEAVSHYHNHDVPMPSTDALAEVMELLRTVLFPGYFGSSDIKPQTMRYYIGASLDRVSFLLREQIKRGFCFVCDFNNQQNCADCDGIAVETTVKFLESLPEVRKLLASDVQAAYEGDPAARDTGETIFCYPSIKALTNYRVANRLYRLNVPLIPRIITEKAHSETGIDIHPGASIGDKFFMDHGTGIVIGETCIIGKNVRVYQGVTLGAKSFPLDENGKPIKGVRRHPIVEDDVIIYSGATILGRVTIGRGSVIGGNVWLTRDVPPFSKVMQGALEHYKFENGSGI